MKKSLIFAGILSMSLYVSAKDNKPVTFNLKNGMKVVVLPNHRAPVVYHSVWYNVGAVNDPYLKSGLAHFSEHMMFKATKTRPTGTFTKMAEKYGARYNATTFLQRTNYYETVDVSYLEQMMELEADRMVNLEMNLQEVNSERDVVIAERMQVVDTPPAARLSEMALSHYYLHHPYRIPVIGWKHEMQTYNKDDIRGFYDQWYKPNNAVLILSGDVTVEKAKELAEKHYGSIPAKPLTRIELPKEPNNHNITANLSLSDKDFATPNFEMWFKSVSWKEDLKKAYAVEVLSSLLSGKTGLWYDTLVENEKIATSIKIEYQGNIFDVAAPFVIAVSLPKGGDVAKAQQRVKELIAKLMTDDLSDADVNLAKIKTTNFFDYIKENPTAYGNFVGEFFIKGFTLEEIESIRDEVEKITKEDVKKIIKEIFTDLPRVVAVGLPEEKKEGAKS